MYLEKSSSHPPISRLQNTEAVNCILTIIWYCGFYHPKAFCKQYLVSTETQQIGYTFY